MTDTTTAWLIVTLLGFIAFVVYVLAENASSIRAWVGRDPVDLDAADFEHRGDR